MIITRLIVTWLKTKQRYLSDKQVKLLRKFFFTLPSQDNVTGTYVKDFPLKNIGGATAE